MAVLLTACVASPMSRPDFALGSVLEVRPLDVIGTLTIKQATKTDALEGFAAQQTVCPCSGVEYVVKLDTGETILVAQELMPAEHSLGPNTRVTIRTKDGERKVVPAPGV